MENNLREININEFVEDFFGINLVREDREREENRQDNLVREGDLPFSYPFCSPILSTNVRAETFAFDFNKVKIFINFLFTISPHYESNWVNKISVGKDFQNQFAVLAYYPLESRIQPHKRLTLVKLLRQLYNQLFLKLRRKWSYAESREYFNLPISFFVTKKYII